MANADQSPDVLGTGWSGTSTPPPLRLAVGLGDPERERELLSALSESDEFVVAARCLAAEPLLAHLQRDPIDAALVASDLHRLNSGNLKALARTRVPLVFLVARADDDAWRSFPGIILPLDANAEAVRQALLDAVRGERLMMAPPSDDSAVLQAEADRAAEAPPDARSPIVVASGHGSPGRTTVALNLAAALGAVAPTVLVDADLSGPSVAAYLDLDPTRNLSMLAYAEPETPREWERAIDRESQPLGFRSPHGSVICGIPKPEMRAGLSPRFFERLVGELQLRYRYIILDIGADLLGAEAAVHRVALGIARQILLVASADLAGLWHARTALGLLKNHLQIGSDRVALTINRHDRRYHHGRGEIEWALGVPTAAVLPYDHGGAQRALMTQRPVVLNGRSRLGRALLDLAERVYGGRIVLPPEPASNGRWRWRQWVAALRWPWSRSSGVVENTVKGAPDGDYATPIGLR